jgi:Cu-Zn family superoxide dismutase
MKRVTMMVVAGLAAVTVAAPVAATGSDLRWAWAEMYDASGEYVGWASFFEDGRGRLHVGVNAHGLSTGLHGIHIHHVGQCSPTFASAGSHHNPLGATHGSHAGDLPNLVVNDAGRGRLRARTTAATLTAGPLSVFDADGSALIIHADSDDLVTDPTGNSGARIACGVIQSG